MNVTPDPRTALNRRRLLQLGGTGAVAAALAACSGGDNGGSGGASASATPLSSESLAAELAKPAELTFWTWVPDITDEVALFTAAYPNIKVNVVNAGQSADEYTKLRTALKAGTGAPDVVQIEFPYIPTFTFTNDLLDLTPYGAADLKADYVDWTWSQVTSGDGIYAIPQDTGPLGMLYRDDIFTQYGLTPPTTWQEFADTGTQLHAANPSVSMMNYASNDAGQTFGYSWQAGARPFALDGETVTIKLNSPEMKKVASFWDPLVKAGVVTTDTDFNNDWYAALTNGNYATWVTAAWAPVFLQSSAAASAGKWRATAMPQWNAGENISGNWGGSTSAVTAKTQYPAAAAAFAMFLNHDPASSLQLANQQFLFPPKLSTLSDPAFTDQASDFYGGQQVNALFAEISDTVSTDFEWSPFNDYVTSSHNDIYGTALTAKASLTDALDTWQADVVAYAKKQGFTVVES
jgi:multiple sugar transport system substrate-binding protein